MRVVAGMVEGAAPLRFVRGFVLVACGFAASCVGGREDQSTGPSRESPEDSSGGATVSGGRASGNVSVARGGKLNNAGGLGGAPVATGGSKVAESSSAGRGEESGEAIVQTLYPTHYSVQLACRQDYPAFYEREVHFRRAMRYPPFISMVNVPNS